MAIRISDTLQNKVEKAEADVAKSKIEQKQTAIDRVNTKQDQNNLAKDLTDLGSHWSIQSSSSLQNMNQYAASAHRMSSLAEKFSQLMIDEHESDWVDMSSPGDVKEGVAEEAVPFSDFGDVDLSDQTSQERSINDALNQFSKRLDAERKAETRDRLINGRAEDKAALAQEAHVKIKRLRIDKVVLKEKLARLTNPEVDVVIAAGAKELEQKRAQPKPKPDISVERNKYIMKNPQPDAAAIKRNELTHERFMDCFKPSPVVAELANIVDQKNQERAEREKLIAKKKQREKG